MRRFWKRHTTLLLIGVAVAGTLWWVWRNPQRVPVVRDWFAPTDTILVIGLDEGNRADCLLLVYPRASGIWVIALPRDTYCTGSYKINGLYKRLGAERFRELVASIVGHPVEHHVVVPFKRLPNFLKRAFPDGLEVYVPYRLRYKDRAAGFSYDIPAGKRRLSPEQLGWFLRDRFSDPRKRGDLARIERWRIFLHAAFDELRKPSNIGRLPAIANEACSTFPTSLSVWKATALAKVCANAPSIHTSVLPGRPVRVGKALFVQLDKQAVRRQASLARTGIVVPPGTVVWVLNGTTRTGLARTYAQRISHHFGVPCQTGNALSTFTQSTTVTYTSESLAPLAEEIRQDIMASVIYPHPEKYDKPLIFVTLGNDAEPERLTDELSRR